MSAYLGIELCVIQAFTYTNGLQLYIMHHERLSSKGLVQENAVT